MTYTAEMLGSLAGALDHIDSDTVESMVDRLLAIRAAKGRLFVIGSGGAAAIASHAVIDLRKGCGIDAQAPTDGVEELTARTNDDGWESVFAGFLDVASIGPSDAVLIFSIGGGDVTKGTSLNIIRAVELAKAVGASVLGIVANAKGFTASNADHAIVFDTLPGPVAMSAFAAAQKIVTTHPRLRR